MIKEKIKYKLDWQKLTAWIFIIGFCLWVWSLVL